MGNNSMFAAACATDGKTAGWLPESYGFLRIHKVNIYYAMAEYQVVWPNAELWRGYYNAGDDGLKWSGWQPIATATTPQEFNLSLAEGITTSSRCVYWKNQFDEVTVICDCNIPEGVSATAFAALPSGFRPAARCIFNASMWESGIARSGGCSIDVFPNGQLDFYSGGYTTDIRIWGLCKFVAVS